MKVLDKTDNKIKKVEFYDRIDRNYRDEGFPKYGKGRGISQVVVLNDFGEKRILIYPNFEIIKNKKYGKRNQRRKNRGFKIGS